MRTGRRGDTTDDGADGVDVVEGGAVARLSARSGGVDVLDSAVGQAKKAVIDMGGVAKGANDLIGGVNAGNGERSVAGKIEEGEDASGSAVVHVQETARNVIGIDEHARHVPVIVETDGYDYIAVTDNKETRGAVGRGTEETTDNGLRKSFGTIFVDDDTLAEDRAGGIDVDILNALLGGSV